MMRPSAAKHASIIAARSTGSRSLQARMYVSTLTSMGFDMLAV
jgi:hypothetical protein